MSEERTTLQFTLGQVVFIGIFLLAAAFILFYLGARFGPQFFWNVDVTASASFSLLPQKITEAELEALLQETKMPRADWSRHLEGKSETPPAIEPSIDHALALKTVDNEVPGALPPAPVKEEPMKKEETKSPQLKGEEKPVEKEPASVAVKKEDTKAVASKPVAKTEPVRKEAPKPAPQTVKPVALQTQPEPKPLPPPQETSPPPPPREEEEPVRGPAGLRLGAYARFDQAQDIQKKVKKLGFDIQMKTLSEGGQNRYLLNIGPFATHSEAMEAKARIQSLAGVSPQIVP